MSCAGKSCLLQSVSNLMANYIMNCYAIPRAILRRINLAQTKFLWGKKRNKFCRLLSWDKICKPKTHDVIGPRSFTTMNEVLLCKLSWKILSDQDSLLSKIILAKYGHTLSNQHKGSELQKGIKVGNQKLKGKFIWKIGDGKMVKHGFLKHQILSPGLTLVFNLYKEPHSIIS